MVRNLCSNTGWSKTRGFCLVDATSLLREPPLHGDDGDEYPRVGPVEDAPGAQEGAALVRLDVDLQHHRQGHLALGTGSCREGPTTNVLITIST